MLIRWCDDLEMENCKPVKTPPEKTSVMEANLKLTTPTIAPDRVKFLPVSDDESVVCGAGQTGHRRGSYMLIAKNA